MGAPDPTNAMTPLCADLQAESDELTAVLGLLAPGAWDVSTPATGWSIRDQVSHLAYFDDAAVVAATDAERFVELRAALLESTDPDAAGITKGRSIEPHQLLAWFESSRAAMISVFAPLDPRARIPWYGPSMAATSFATARLMETWAHGQDIVDALGHARVPTARLRHVAHIGVRARAFSYLVNGREPASGEVAVRLRAPDGSLWTWNDGAAEHDVVEGDALDFCLLVTQRRHRADTGLVARGPLAEEWISIAQAFAGPPGGGRDPGQFPRDTRH